MTLASLPVVKPSFTTREGNGLIHAALLAYFLVVAFAVVLVVFPGYRTRVISGLWLALDNVRTPLSRSFCQLYTILFAIQQAFLRRFSGSATFIWRNPLLVGASVLAIAAPSMIVFVMGGPAVYDFSEGNTVADRQIAILLEGEQLVPPPSLPPEAFSTREVETVRPDVVHASRNWNLLDPEFTQRLLVAFKLMKERHGYEMVLIEGYRGPGRQEQLLAQGRHVTQVGANMSYHQYGLAADSAFYRDGKIVISERDPWAMRGYELYGHIAEQLGLTWGGAWKMQDYGHVELHRKGVLGRAAG